MADFPTSLEAFLASDSDDDHKPLTEQSHNSIENKEDDEESCPSMEVRELVWEAITKQVPKSEWPVMRSILGEKLLEHNEDLKRELLSLHVILHELLQQSAAREARQRHRQEAREMRQRQRLEAGQLLPEPPMKDAIRRDIQSFIASIMADPTTRTEPDAADRVLRPQSARERVVLEYAGVTGQSPHGSESPSCSLARCESGSSHRPASASGARRGGRESAASVRPMSAASRSSRSSGRSGRSSQLTPVNSKEVVAGVAGYLRMDGIDSVVTHLREALAAERDALLDDLDFTRLLLDEEMSSAVPCGESQGDEDVESDAEESTAPEPSVAELQTLRARIKEDWKTTKERAARLDMLQHLPQVTNRIIAGGGGRSNANRTQNSLVRPAASGTAVASPSSVEHAPSAGQSSTALDDKAADVKMVPTPPKRPKPKEMRDGLDMPPERAFSSDKTQARLRALGLLNGNGSTPVTSGRTAIRGRQRQRNPTIKSGVS